MIAFKSQNVDSNTSNAALGQSILTVPRPAAMVDGDFLLAAIGVSGGSAVAVTPPTGWTQIRRVDASAVASVITYYRIAQGEPSAGWSWQFSKLDKHTACVAVYTGVDSFSPVDADAVFVGAGNTNFTIPSVTTSIANTLLVGATACNGTAAPSVAIAWSIRSSANNSGASVLLEDSYAPSAGATTSINGQMGGGGFSSATHLIALRPSVGQTALEQVRQAFKSAFPPGDELLYDWDNADADIYKLTVAIATHLKANGYDYVDLTRREFSPLTAVVKLSDWEAAFGITQTASTSQNQWISTRQGNVLGKLREQGGSTADVIRAAVEPFLGYTTGNLNTSQIIECNRVGLTALHTYVNTTGFSVTTPGNVAQTVVVADDGQVSVGGVQVTITLTTTAVDNVKIVLTGPTGSQATVPWDNGISNQYFGTGAVTAKTFTLFNATPWGSTGSVGGTIRGTWTLTVTAGSANVTVSRWSLFVEGAGLDGSTYTYNDGQATYTLQHSGLGTAIYDWGLYADPAKVNNPDYAGALRAIQRVAPGGTRPHIFRTLNPLPGASTLIPGQFFPVGQALARLGIDGDVSAVNSSIGSHNARRLTGFRACSSQSITDKLPLP